MGAPRCAMTYNKSVAEVQPDAAVNRKDPLVKHHTPGNSSHPTSWMNTSPDVEGWGHRRSPGTERGVTSPWRQREAIVVLVAKLACHIPAAQNP